LRFVEYFLGLRDHGRDHTIRYGRQPEQKNHPLEYWAYRRKPLWERAHYWIAPNGWPVSGPGSPIRIYCARPSATSTGTPPSTRPGTGTANRASGWPER